MAIINGDLLEVGDKVEGREILKIEKDGVYFTGVSEMLRVSR